MVPQCRSESVVNAVHIITDQEAESKGPGIRVGSLVPRNKTREVAMGKRMRERVYKQGEKMQERGREREGDQNIWVI